MTKVYLCFEQEHKTSFSLLSSRHNFMCGVVNKNKIDIMPTVLTQYLLINGNENTTFIFDNDDSDLCDLLNTFCDRASYVQESAPWKMFDSLFIYSLYSAEVHSCKELSRMRTYAKNLLETDKKS